jgi:hypothetical protein
MWRSRLSRALAWCRAALFEVVPVRFASGLILSAVFLVFMIERYRDNLKALVVLDYLRVLLSPHLVIGALVLFFLIRFRLVMEAGIARLTSFEGPAGIKATFEAQRLAIEAGKKAGGESLQPTTPQNLELRLSEDLKLADEPTLQAKKTDEPPLVSGKPDPRLVAELRRATANAFRYWSWWQFERVWQQIFRSQVSLLQYLFASPGRKAKWSELQAFYNQGIVASGTRATSYPYQNYMQYLANAGLIVWTVSGADPDVMLTTLGESFLRYIAQQNYNIFDRPF